MTVDPFAPADPDRPIQRPLTGRVLASRICARLIEAGVIEKGSGAHLGMFEIAEEEGSRFRRELFTTWDHCK
jgi:hypothetical protein